MKFKWLDLSIILIVINLINASQVDELVSKVVDNSKKFSDYWIIKINGSLDEIKQLANEHSFKIIGPVGSLEGFFHVKSEHKRRKRSTDGHSLTSSIRKSERAINSHPNVELFEREKLLVRKKRDYIEMPIRTSFQGVLRRKKNNVQVSDGPTALSDPFWNKMWYLNRHTMVNSDLPDMNVTGAWALGYSGRGVSVTFLDDGLEWDHPDIQQNYDPKASTDINGNDENPMPRYDDTNENKHGTRCAGEVAAVANNSVCSVGVAFNAGIGGIRMLDGDVTDSVEANSLSYNKDHIHIYSASWGPDDNGEVVDGPGFLAKKAFADGAAQGRNGLGSIYVWASGNGGRFNDSCACDGYANSIYTLSISSTSENSEKPWYLEECTSTLATTYSSGDERHGEREIVTTDIRHKCTEKHTGTSAAAPIAAGIIALALEANPTLTWRDIMYLIVLSSHAKSIKTNNFIMNKRGFLVSSRYGFGLMNAGRMVELAKTWKNVPSMQSCITLNSNFKLNSIHQTNSIEATLTTDACMNTINEVNFIEQVEVIVTVRAQVRGLLEIYLTSPMGTKSLILPQRSRDLSSDGFRRWTFMTVQLWGEFPRGDWKLLVSSADGSIVQLDDFMIIIHGTKTKPVDYENYIETDQVNCDKDCLTNGKGCPNNCKFCDHYLLHEDQGKTKCVTYCPIGYYANEPKNKCIKCDNDCLECNGPTKSNCTSCKNKLFLKLDTNECVSNCPLETGYFLNSENQCQPCDGACLTCLYTSKYCLSCKQALDYSYVGQSEFILKNNTCALKENENCETGYYYDLITKKCQFCDIKCAECSTLSPTDCLACSEKRPYLKDGECVAQCGEGFYLNKNINSCLKCNDKCQACDEQNKCSSCVYGYSLNENNECTQTLLNGNSCHDRNCYECFGKESKQCLVCNDQTSLFGGECVEKIPTGYFRKGIKATRGIIYKIEKCSGHCMNCTDEKTCIICDKEFTLIHDRCFPHCDSNSYVSEDGKCNPCQYPCEKCFNQTRCITCKQGRHFFDGKCLEKCPDSHYSKDSICLPCHPSCDTCFGPDLFNCLSCTDGFRYENNKCSSLCPEGTYYDSLLQECNVCNSMSCAECVKTANTCTKCNSPFALDLSTYTCKPCCSRSIHGKMTSLSCCNCASKYDGYCLKANHTETEIKKLFNIITNKSINSYSVVTVFLFIISSLVIIVSLVLLKPFQRKAKDYGSVQYTPLVE